MQGMSERQYAAPAGLSRGAIQKAKAAERLVLFSDGSIDAVGSDSRRAETLMFRLAREERNAWVTWPARAAALMAAELSASRSEATGQQITVEPAAM